MPDSIKEALKGVKPSDIEPIDPRHLTEGGGSKDSDTIMRINLKAYDKPLFVIALIEHQSTTDYRMPFRMLLYVVLIMYQYERSLSEEAREELGKKGFKYPPVLPIVFYDGKGKWNAQRNIKKRIYRLKGFERYMPGMEYYVVNLNKYSVKTLAKNKDALTYIMLVDKVQSVKDAKILKKIPADYTKYFNETDFPEDVLDVMAFATKLLLERAELDKETIDRVIARILKKEDRHMWFEALGKDVQRHKALIADYQKRESDYQKRESDYQRERADYQKRIADLESQLIRKESLS
jgi:hypothetical protein